MTRAKTSKTALADHKASFHWIFHDTSILINFMIPFCHSVLRNTALHLHWQSAAPNPDYRHTATPMLHCTEIYAGPLCQSRNEGGGNKTPPKHFAIPLRRPARSAAAQIHLRHTVQQRHHIFLLIPAELIAVLFSAISPPPCPYVSLIYF